MLALHLAVLAVLAVQWLQSAKVQTGHTILIHQRLSPEYIVYTLVVSNFVGIVFARTLHYQFYVWYFYSLALILWISGRYPIWMRVVLMGAVEYAFNVFPATPTSSAVLQVAHLLLLLCIRPPQALQMAIVDYDTVVVDDKKSR